VALGVDRLLMTLLNENSLSAVQAFPQSRDQ
jgi:elongation factor P--beta-lysine ligase